MNNTRLTLAILGAGGKMGCRLTDHLKDRPDYTMLHVETGERGLANLRERGLTAVPRDEALARADVVILALPDRILGAVARDVVPLVRPGTLVMMLGLDTPLRFLAAPLAASASNGGFLTSRSRNAPAASSSPI